MLCPKCRCEIGTLEQCPYCGARLRNPTRTVPVAPSKGYRQDYSSIVNRISRTIASIYTCCMLAVILLGGIFVIELLQLILAALK